MLSLPAAVLSSLVPAIVLYLDDWIFTLLNAAASSGMSWCGAKCRRGKQSLIF